MKLVFFGHSHKLSHMHPHSFVTLRNTLLYGCHFVVPLRDTPAIIISPVLCPVEGRWPASFQDLKRCHWKARQALSKAKVLAICLHSIAMYSLEKCKHIYLRRGDESQPLARIFLFPHRNVVVAAMIEVITPNVLFQSRVNRSPNHLQHLWKTSPCFATLHPPFLSITSHPLANYLVPNRNGRCSPLSFGVPPFSSVFPLLLMICLHILSFFFNFFSCRSFTFLRFPPP